MENNIDLYLEKLSELRKLNKAFVTCSMVAVVGSAPQDPGAKMVVSSEGLCFGTVGGGKIENHAIQYALEMLKDDSSKVAFKEWNLQTDIGMTCGGVVKLFFEKQEALANWRVAVFGAGHVSQELCRMLLRLNCHISCIDNREEWLGKLPDHERLKKVHLTEMKNYVPELSDNTYVALMTMGHATDSPILGEALLNRNFPYLGVIGSKVKRVAIEKDLQALGISKERCNDFICPIGEKLGGNSPAEIAISIAAQLLKVRDELKKSS